MLRVATIKPPHGEVIWNDPDEAIPSPVPAGTVVKIGLAGFRPGQTVKLRIHHASYDQFARARYVTSLSVRMDREGQALRTLQTNRGDPAGCYSVRSDPSASNDLVLIHGVAEISFCLQ
jgi:hypothetical protein